jgi:site-specific recombinase XerC
LTVCYAAGLRISEAVRLKTRALDDQRMVIGVAQGKGRKDRYVCPERFAWGGAEPVKTSWAKPQRVGGSYGDRMAAALAR